KTPSGPTDWRTGTPPPKVTWSGRPQASARTCPRRGFGPHDGRRRGRRRGATRLGPRPAGRRGGGRNGGGTPHTSAALVEALLPFTTAWWTYTVPVFLAQVRLAPDRHEPSSFWATPRGRRSLFLGHAPGQHHLGQELTDPGLRRHGAPEVELPIPGE